MRLSPSQTGSTQGQLTVHFKPPSQSVHANQSSEDGNQSDQYQRKSSVDVEEANSVGKEPQAAETIDKINTSDQTEKEVHTVIKLREKESFSQPERSIFDGSQDYWKDTGHRPSSDPRGQSSKVKKKAHKTEKEKLLEDVKKNPLVVWKDSESDTGNNENKTLVSTFSNQCIHTIQITSMWHPFPVYI